MSVQQGNDRDETPAPSAVQWFARLQDASELSPEDQHELERWTAQARNIDELMRIEALWQGLEALPPPANLSQKDVAADDYDESQSIRDWIQEGTPHRRVRQITRRFGVASIAAGLAALAVTGFLVQSHRLPRTAREHVQSYVTPQGENRVITLPDGSTVTLSARTEVSAQYTANRRVVVLERGEAWFNVSHDADRPFTVLAGGGAITALGTQFNVRRDLDVTLDRVTVIVSSGTVEVAPSSVALPDTQMSAPALTPQVSATPSGSPWHATRLIKGQEVTYDTQGPKGDVHIADLEAAGAWKEGRLEFRHQPLKYVIPEINRYSAKPIVLTDSAAAEIEFSGTVFQGQIDDWVRAVATAFPLEVTETDQQFFIRAKGGTSSRERSTDKLP